MNVLLLAFGVFAVAFTITGVWRQSRLGKSLLDLPNARSSHSQPTPRGGGVAIVAAFISGVAVFAIRDPMSWQEIVVLIFASGAVAGVGILDDLGTISVSARLFGQLLAAVVVVAVIGGAPSVAILGRVWNLGIAGNVLAVIYLVWILNLYNFMDGIDGIAAMEGFTVCVGAALILLARVPSLNLWPVSLLLGASSLGFLLWNFPSAKIFMGDVGSGFLGFVIGILSLITTSVAPEMLWSWLILLGVFIVDATITLARRVLRRERFYEAHRSHAYQHAARKLGVHWPVTLTVATINVCWLFPLAFAVALRWLDGAVGTLVAYIPLLVIAARLDAGARDS